MILAAAGVSSVVALNNQLLLTPRSTPADWGGVKLSFRATDGRHLSARGGTGRLSAVREGRHPDHRGLFCRGRHPDDRWRRTKRSQYPRRAPLLDTTSTTVSMSAGARTVAHQTPATRTMLRSRPPRFSNAPLISSVSPCDSPERNPNCRQEPPRESFLARFGDESCPCEARELGSKATAARPSVSVDNTRQKR